MHLYESKGSIWLSDKAKGNKASNNLAA